MQSMDTDRLAQEAGLFARTVAAVQDALVQEGFARYAPGEHAGFVVTAGFPTEDGEPPMVVLNFATDQEDNGPLIAKVQAAYRVALEFNGFHVEGSGGDAVDEALVCWE